MKYIFFIFSLLLIFLNGCASSQTQTDLQACKITTIKEPKKIKKCRKKPTLWRQLGIEK